MTPEATVERKMYVAKGMIVGWKMYVARRILVGQVYVGDGCAVDVKWTLPGLCTLQ